MISVLGPVLWKETTRTVAIPSSARVGGWENNLGIAQMTEEGNESKIEGVLTSQAPL